MCKLTETAFCDFQLLLRLFLFFGPRRRGLSKMDETKRNDPAFSSTTQNAFLPTSTCLLQNPSPYYIICLSLSLSCVLCIFYSLYLSISCLCKIIQLHSLSLSTYPVKEIVNTLLLSILCVYPLNQIENSLSLSLSQLPLSVQKYTSL